MNIVASGLLSYMMTKFAFVNFVVRVLRILFALVVLLRYPPLAKEATVHRVRHPSVLPPVSNPSFLGGLYSLTFLVTFGLFLG